VVAEAATQFLEGVDIVVRLLINKGSCVPQQSNT